MITFSPPKNREILEIVRERKEKRNRKRKEKKKKAFYMFTQICEVLFLTFVRLMFVICSFFLSFLFF